MTVATAAEYTDFLRRVGGSKYEPIRRRAEMLDAYAHFKPAIARLKYELADTATPRQHPILGDSLISRVFLIEEGDKKYAVRIPKNHKIKARTVDGRLAGAALGKNIPHLEQIVAASYEDGVTVAEVMPGKEISILTPEEVSQVSDEQIGALVDTLITANKHDIEIDTKPSNFFYDPEAGYGIVDYHSAKVASKNSKNQTIGDIVGSASGAISNAGFYGKDSDLDKTVDDYARDLKLHEANLNVLQRYRTIAANKLNGEEQLTALKKIDDTVSNVQDEIAFCSNPEWVAETIANNQKRKRQQAERPQNSPNGSVSASADII